MRTESTLDRVKRFLASPILTVVVSVIVVIAVLIFLILTTATLQTTAATSSNDMGLMFLRIFGWTSPVTAWLVMPFFAGLAFVYGVKEYREELKQDDSQAIRFVIIGCAFIVVAIMIGIFSIGVPVTILRQ